MTFRLFAPILALCLALPSFAQSAPVRRSQSGGQDVARPAPQARAQQGRSDVDETLAQVRRELRELSAAIDRLARSLQGSQGATRVRARSEVSQPRRPAAGGVVATPRRAEGQAQAPAAPRRASVVQPPRLRTGQAAPRPPAPPSPPAVRMQRTRTGQQAGGGTDCGCDCECCQNCPHCNPGAKAPRATRVRSSGTTTRSLNVQGRPYTVVQDGGRCAPPRRAVAADPEGRMHVRTFVPQPAQVQLTPSTPRTLRAATPPQAPKAPQPPKAKSKGLDEATRRRLISV